MSVDTKKVMKLSEAIRLGAMMGPQTCFWGGCALSAACDAIGQLRTHLTISAHWPWVHQECRSPINQNLFGPVWMIIEALNGFETIIWTRERIASWVATIEPKEDADASSGHHRELEVPSQRAAG